MKEVRCSGTGVERKQWERIREDGDVEKCRNKYARNKNNNTDNGRREIEMGELGGFL